jgi:hypothetical protein
LGSVLSTKGFFEERLLGNLRGRPRRYKVKRHL